MQYIGSLEAAEKNIFLQKSSRKSAHFCKDIADLNGSSRFSATIFAEPCRKNPADLHRFAKIENLGRWCFNFLKYHTFYVQLLQ